jgi:hypothetical protein
VVDGDTEAQPPDRELGEIEQGVGAGERDAIVGADGDGTAAFAKQAFEAVKARSSRVRPGAPSKSETSGLEIGAGVAETAAKGTSVILVLNQYKCIGCSPGKHPDTRTMATGSDEDSRDSVYDRSSCIAAWPSEQRRSYERRDRRRAR